MSRAAIAFVLLAGCAAPVISPEGEAVEAAFAVWREHYLLELPACDAARHGIVWRAAGEEAFVGPLADKGAFSSFEHLGPPTITLRIDPSRSAHDTRLLRGHELAHWMMDCSGRWAYGDSEHRDAVVWAQWVPEMVRLEE